MLVNTIQNTISSFRSALAAASVITTNLKMWLGFETSETIGKNIYDGNIIYAVNGGTFTDNGNGTFTVTGDGKPNIGIGVRDFDADYLTIGDTYKFSTQGANTTVAVYNSSFSLLTSGINSVEFQATTSSIKLYISPTNGVSATYSDVEVRKITQITPDKSGNNNVGELFTGKAIDFNGSTDYVDVDGFQMAGTNATFAFWFNSNDTLGRFFDTVKDLSDNRFIISFHNNQISILDHTISWFNFGSVTTNVWNRCVITINGTTAKCFVNGVQLGTDKTISTIDLSSSTDAAIGSHVFGTQSYFDGSLSDFQIYNSAWSTDDIAFDYANPNILVTDSTNTGTSIAVTNLKAYWAMSEGAGSIAYDSSGEGNNGTINGATYEPAQLRIPQLGMQNWAKSTPVADEITLIPNPTIPTQDILGNAVRDRLNSFNLGKFGGARVDAFTLSGNQATIQLWFKNVNSNDSLYLADLHSATDRIVLGFNSSQLSVFHEITGSWQNFGTITDGDWNFATFTFDGTSLKCFIGTSQLGVTKTITAINIGTTTDFGVGMNHSFPTRTQDYNGHISDFLFYDRVLTSDEIENNYNAGLSAHTND